MVPGVERTDQKCLIEVGSADLVMPFVGFPKDTLLESGAIPIAEIAELALREGQCTNPIYRVHRWFARRLGSQFRAILTGLSLKPEEADRFWDLYLGNLSLDGAVVLDPFVGGGTSLVEAGRCGARVMGYDIDPVATCITRFELEAGGYNPSTLEIAELCATVSVRLASFHKTNVPGSGERIVLHHFWVECRTCSACGTTFEIHPHYQLAYSKEKGLQWVFCKNCHEVSETAITRKELRCGCGIRTRIGQGTLTHGKVRCPNCGDVSGLGDRGDAPKRPEWRLFAQEYLEETPTGVTRHFKAASKGDRIRYGQARTLLEHIERADGSFAPHRTIPTVGRSDQRPLIHGFTRYRDLFNDRQLLHLTLLGRAITGIEEPWSRRLLAIAFSEHLTTNCMYTAYAFGYRRISAMFSIHGYRHITRPVEINPWLNGIGRGTFPNVLGKIAKAVSFVAAPTDLNPKGGRKPAKTYCHAAAMDASTQPARVLNGSSRASISTKTSESLEAIPDRTIDLILTDPPYFDNLSYSELSDFYLAWHQSLGMAEPPYDDATLSAPIKENLALTDRGNESVEVYRKSLRRIFCECRRVLRKDGILVFTYHHKSPVAWGALGDALARSGLKCTAVLPLRGEGQGGLHSYSGTIKWDAVFVCRKGTPVSSDNSDETVVPLAAIKQAQQQASAYAEELAKARHIAFREPDRINLERAMIVASAIVAPVSLSFVPLPDALKSKQTGGR
jgi:adenine-specific DNA methylase